MQRQLPRRVSRLAPRSPPGRPTALRPILGPGPTGPCQDRSDRCMPENQRGMPGPERRSGVYRERAGCEDRAGAVKTSEERGSARDAITNSLTVVTVSRVMYHPPRVVGRASGTYRQDMRCLPKDRPPRCFSTRSAPISVPRPSGRPSSLICSRWWLPGARRRTELASACQAAPRGIRILADYLTILGFLHKHGDRYELTADAKAFLDRASPAYLGGAIAFHARARD